MDLVPLLTITIDLEAPDLLGDFPTGERRLIRFAGGTFTGSIAGVDGGAGEVRGVVAPGGLDWQTVRADGVIEISAHYLLRTEQGEAIEVRSEGLRVMSADVQARVAAGERVDPSEYYFRTHIRLATSSPRLHRLDRLIGVSSGERRAMQVLIDVHEVR